MRGPNIFQPIRINSTIAEKVLPSIENAIGPTRTNSNAKWDLRSDGPHSNKNGQMAQNCDPRSYGLHQSKKGGINCKTRVDFPKMNSTKGNHDNIDLEKVQ